MMLVKICALIVEALVIGLIAARLSSWETPAVRMFGLAILSVIIGYLALDGIERIGNELVSQAAAPPSGPPTSPPR
jgi:hypothetical protein